MLVVRRLAASAALRNVRYLSTRPTILAVGTMDTKAEELKFVAQCIRGAGCTVELADVSCSQGARSHVDATIARETVAAHHPEGAAAVLNVEDRGEAVSAMTAAFINYVKNSAFDGIVGIGGSGGTALITPAMQALPVGTPKVMVTTMAAGDVSAYVGASDITIMPSVVDVAGLNSISRAILGNAAAAVSGMALYPPRAAPPGAKPTLAVTMFGVTTPCCDAVRKALEGEYEVLTFHATGAGGKAMEKLLASDMLAGVLDLTTTEIADEVVGGVLSAGPERLDALASSTLPAVVSVGALDIVNFGNVKTVPAEFKDRKLHVHNAQVTLMRTTPEELQRVAQFMCEKLNRAQGPLTLLLPEAGVSLIDKDGMPFDDPAARTALFEELEKHFEASPNRRIRRVATDINDPAFSSAAVDAFREMVKESAASGAPSPSGGATAGAAMGTGGGAGRRGSPTSSAAGPTESGAGTPVHFSAASLPPTIPGPRDPILAKLRAMVANDEAIIGAGAGTGISAKFEEAGGADLIVVYNSGRFRMGGHGSLAGLLPFKDANAVMLEMGKEILPVLGHTPLLAGICATDPFRRMDQLLEEVKGLGFAGVQNFPTVGLIDGTFRQNLEETGMSYEKEVEMIQMARGMGLLTTPYVFNEDESRRMAAAGADVIVAHMGLTTKGSIGASTALTLDQSVERVQAIADAARAVNPEVIVLTHGGPISMPEDAQYVLERVSGVHGFYGASSMERLPVEVAITEQMRQFKAVTLKK